MSSTSCTSSHSYRIVFLLAFKVNGLYWRVYSYTNIPCHHPLPMSVFTTSGTMSSKWGGSTAWIASLAGATVATAATAAVAATLVSPPIVDTAEITAEILAGRGGMGGAHLGKARGVGGGETEETLLTGISESPRFRFYPITWRRWGTLRRGGRCSLRLPRGSD